MKQYILASFILINIFLSGCKKDDEKDDSKDFDYSENLLVIDSLSLLSISSFSSDGQVVVPGGTTLSGQLKPGMIIAAGISTITPYGFLKKITSISSTGAEITVSTVNASFEDVFINASVQFSKQLSLNDIPRTFQVRNGISLKSVEGEGFFIEADDFVLYDYDGDPETTGDQIKADGSIFLDPVFNFNFDIRNRRLEHFYFSLQNTQTTELSIYAGSEVLSREVELPLIRIPMNPIYVPAGMVPIVVVPVLEITIGSKLEVNVRVQTELTQSATLEYGVQYLNGSWEPISHAEVSYNFQPPQLSASVELKGYFGPQFNLLLYGLAGPYTDANAFLKLEADIFDMPWWTLYGGGEIGVGVQVDFLGQTIADFYLPNVLDYQKLVAQANGEAEGSIRGNVKDALSLYGLEGVDVTIIKDNLDIGLTVTDYNGQFYLQSPIGENIMVQFAKSGYIPVTYHNVAVMVGEDTYLEPVLQIDNAHNGIGTISGSIINALDGNGVANCSLSLRTGINAIEGNIVTSGISQNDGSYSIPGLQAGHYTIQCQKDGFTDSYFSVVCIGGINQQNQNGTMTPALSENEIRIILTWGEFPSDLDSHLTGPDNYGDRFHVYYHSPSYSYNGVTFAALDHDDIYSYGPETITIYEFATGLYRYSVHDYVNKDYDYSIALSNSSAQVRVYQGSTMIANFNIPQNIEGTLWTVFELNNGHIEAINSLTYESLPGAVNNPNQNNDSYLLKDLPPKR